MQISRRGFVAATVTGSAGLLAAGRAFGAEECTPETGPGSAAGNAPFGQQDPELVKEIVGKSHFDLDGVKRLVEKQPELAKSSWDWGFGDWETPLGAASHTGRREIAEVLIASGARPTLFTAAMLGQLDVVRAAVEASPGAQRNLGPHGITLLAHARKGGEQAAGVVSYLESLGDADTGYAALETGPELRATYLGVFAFGANRQIEIVERKGQLGATPRGGTRRGLVRVGEHQFHPVGAPSVRLAFTVRDGAAQELTLTGMGEPISGKRSEG